MKMHMNIFQILILHQLELQKNGFKKINNAIMKGFFREVVVSIDGEYGIWCFKND